MSDYKKVEQLLKSGEFDGVDFGCSTGGSIEFAKIHFGAKNVLGIDIDPKKVQKTREKGYTALEGELTSFPELRHKVKFSILSHFLEHLPAVTTARDCIRSAINISEEFVYIQQPYFDADSYLFQHGLKLFWSDWHGHPNRMTVLEFHNYLSRFKDKGKIDSFVIYGYRDIKNSDDIAVHPLTSPEDQSAWDSSLHPTKPKQRIKFKFPVYHEIKVLISLKGDEVISDMEKKFKWSKVLFDSRK